MDTAARVRLGGELSDIFFLRRGVKQGSVLSPLLFLLVIDSLLADLESSGIGVSIDKRYLRGLGFLWHLLHPKKIQSVYRSLTLCEK